MPLGVLLLVFILAVWNPASLALHAASTVWSIETRPALTLAFLAIRLVLAGIGVAAGIALWLRRPGAVPLAKLSLVLFGIETTVRLSSGIDVGNTPPGTRLPLASFVVLHNAAWYLYLHLSRRVRAVYGLESQSPQGHAGPD